MMKYLRLFKESVDSEELIDAAKSGDVREVERLIRSGVHLNISRDDDDGWSALVMASYWNHPEVVKLLIRSGADLNIRGDGGKTALIFASRFNNIEVVKLLIRSGADLNIRDNWGSTALIWASLHNQIEVVKLLIEAGANLNIRSDGGRTALIWNSIENNIEVVKLLLENFADECILDNRGWSFYDHLNNRNKEIIKELYPNEVENAIHFSRN
jgi:ankyrin repeat protein